MKTKFSDFLNEYGGPGRTIGFRYSEPNIDYTFSIHLVINPELKSNDVKKTIEEIFKKHNVGEDSIELKYLGGDEYKLIIKIKAYSKYDILSMFNLLVKNLNKKVGDNVLFFIDSVDLEGRDVNVKRRPIGFKPSKYEDEYDDEE